MIDGATLAWIGGSIGAAVGIAGGVVGTWMGVRNAPRGPARAFAMRCAIWLWLGVAAFLAGLLLLPRAYSYWLWLPYPFLLAGFIAWSKRRMREIEARS